MSDLPIEVTTIAEKLAPHMTIEDGVVKFEDQKKAFEDALPEEFQSKEGKQAFYNSVTHLSNFDSGFKLATATAAAKYMKDSPATDSVSGVIKFKHNKFTANTKRTHETRNPQSGEKSTVNGYTYGGFKLNVSSSVTSQLKAATADLFGDL